MNYSPRNFLIACEILLAMAFCCQACAINIVLDYSLDTNNNNWFGGTPDGLARKASLDSAADFLSAIISNDDWNSLPALNESFSLSDIAASSINDVNGNPLIGTPESDGNGFTYTINTTNRSSVAANEYVVYVAALDFDSSTSANAKAAWDSFDYRNQAGIDQTEFNTWGGKVYFNTAKPWYTGLNPGVDPSDDYGIQDPDKTPATDITTDNWDWHTGLHVWKGFDLESIDPTAINKVDLYATAVHELMHALGATTTPISNYVGVDQATGDFIGENLIAEYGGPVPGNGGHFDNDTQSIVWDSDGIISETTLDPNSIRSNRKYLTRLDAALLRDLGYDVLETLANPNLDGDYNNDGIVNAADYTVWLNNLGGSILLPGENPSAATPGVVDQEDYDFWKLQYGNIGSSSSNSLDSLVPEPTAISLWMGAIAFFLAARTRRS